jgi:hypothetical protein
MNETERKSEKKNGKAKQNLKLGLILALTWTMIVKILAHKKKVLNIIW